MVKIYPSNLEDNDFKAFFLALTDCKFAVCYNSLILFNSGDAPNLPATSKKAALPSRARVLSTCPRRAGIIAKICNFSLMTF
ncbi:hypothetical protein AC425_10745 [Salmonella enterica subsp. diarizonae]|nr:hypothetical protein [Salmonella enterica subsp. diarizonae]MIH53458.1 hypothetical protein [Salmonella enterica subsp. diarizonae]